MEAFGGHLRFVGPRAAERLRERFPERAEELDAFGGRLATDSDDDPLHVALHASHKRLEALKRTEGVPEVVIESARNNLAKVQEDAARNAMAPERVRAYPRHAVRWPGYVREARLHLSVLEWIFRDVQLREALPPTIAAIRVAIESGVDDDDVYARSVPDDVSDPQSSRDPQIALAHAAYCVLDWVTQRDERTDQDDLSDILFLRWRFARFGEEVVAEESQRYWKHWLNELVPAAYISMSAVHAAAMHL